jgi:hypothetical protein
MALSLLRSSGRSFVAMRAITVAARAYRGCGSAPALVIGWLITVVFVLPPCHCLAADASQSTALSLLKRCLDVQTKTDRISTQGTSDSTTVSGSGKPFVNHCEFSVRRDGELLDVSGCRVPSNPRFARRFRTVFGRDYVIGYSFPLNNEYKTSAIAWQKDRDFQRLWEFRTGVELGFPLDGYLEGSGGKRAAELLLAAQDVRVIGEEVVDGTRCTSVAGNTEYGKITIWIPQSDSSDALPRKTTITKGPDDLVYPGKKLSEIDVARDTKATRHSEILDQVTVARSEKDWFCSGARTTLILRLAGGGDSTQTCVIKRTKTELSPNFAGTDAFVIDLREGYPVNFMDDSASGVRYEWRGAKVQPASVKFDGETRSAWPERRSTVRIVISVALALAIFVLGLILYLRHASAFRRS